MTNRDRREGDAPATTNRDPRQGETPVTNGVGDGCRASPPRVYHHTTIVVHLGCTIVPRSLRASCIARVPRHAPYFPSHYTPTLYPLECKSSSGGVSVAAARSAPVGEDLPRPMAARRR